MLEHMHMVNALKIRNHLGEVLDLLEKEGGPILVSKGRRIRAVLITPEDFRTRFVDRQAEEERRRLMERIEEVRAPRVGDAPSLDVLRELRGDLR